MQRIKPKAATFILIAILLTAAVLRFWQLDHADVITDEAFLGTRSVGYLDFLGTQAQGTPAEWYPEMPWWAYLSFHDHPPLTFLISHGSFKLFGENAWGLRLPSAIAGIIVIWLLYGIGKILKNEATGLMAAALGAVELYLVWPSRLGLQESVTLALLLTATYCFLKAIDHPRWWWATWTAYALSVMAKYSVIAFLPLVFTYLLTSGRKVFREKNFWISQNVQGPVTLPITVYNIALFATRGHFDVQLSALLGMNVPEWRDLPGKNIGTLAERAADIVPNLIHTASPVLLLLTAGAIMVLLWRWRQPASQFALLGILWMSLLLLLVGPAARFLVMLIPWFILAIAVAGAEIAGNVSRALRPLLITALIAVLGYSCWYTWFNTFTENYTPVNSWTFSQLRTESGTFGYQDLDHVLKKELDAFRPAAVVQLQYPVLQKAAQTGYLRDAAKPIRPLFISYDADLAWPTPIWYFIRRTLYHGWTVITTDGLKTALEEGQLPALISAVFGEQPPPDAAVLLVTGSNTLTRVIDRTGSAAWLIEQLGLSNQPPLAIVGDTSAPRFTLWQVPLSALQALQITGEP